MSPEVDALQRNNYQFVSSRSRVDMLVQRTLLFEKRLHHVSEIESRSTPTKDLLMMILRTMFGPRPLVKVRTPSSRPILSIASKAWLYPNLWPGAFAPSAHILTRPTYNDPQIRERFQRATADTDLRWISDQSSQAACSSGTDDLHSTRKSCDARSLSSVASKVIIQSEPCS